MSDVEQQAKKFRTVGVRPEQQEQTTNVKRVPFYNWLEERD